MTPISTTVVQIPLTFTVDHDSPPPDQPIHHTLRAVRGFEIEAPTTELAELHALLLKTALEHAGS